MLERERRAEALKGLWVIFGERNGAKKIAGCSAAAPLYTLAEANIEDTTEDSVFDGRSAYQPRLPEPEDLKSVPRTSCLVSRVLQCTFV